MPLAQYFAILKFHARFPDGQDGGITRGRLYLENSGLTPSPIVSILRVVVGELSPSRYLVTADGRNLGDARILPRCRCIVRTEDQTTVDQFEMTSDTYVAEQRFGPMLPTEKRSFAGILDLSKLDPGMYRLVVQLDHGLGAGGVNEQRAIAVVQEDGVKKIEEHDLAEIGGQIEIRLE